MSVAGCLEVWSYVLVLVVGRLLVVCVIGALETVSAVSFADSVSFDSPVVNGVGAWSVGDGFSVLSIGDVFSFAAGAFSCLILLCGLLAGCVLSGADCSVFSNVVVVTCRQLVCFSCMALVGISSLDVDRCHNNISLLDGLL